MTTILRLSVLTLSLGLTTNSLPSTSPLEGCAEVESLEGAFRTLIGRWNEWKRAELIDFWPFVLAPEDCSPESWEECTIFSSRSRIIEGKKECAENFVWDVRSGKYQLNLVTIFYSARTLEDANRVAKRLVSVVDPPASAIKVSGGRTPGAVSDHYQWQEDGAEVIVKVLTVEVKQLGSVWRLTLNFSRDFL
jgi:hypothetical protein